MSASQVSSAWAFGSAPDTRDHLRCVSDQEVLVEPSYQAAENQAGLEGRLIPLPCTDLISSGIAASRLIFIPSRADAAAGNSLFFTILPCLTPLQDSAVLPLPAKAKVMSNGHTTGAPAGRYQVPQRASKDHRDRRECVQSFATGAALMV